MKHALLLAIALITFHDSNNDPVYVNPTQVTAIYVEHYITYEGNTGGMFSEHVHPVNHTCTGIALQGGSHQCVIEPIDIVRTKVLDGANR